MNFRLIATDVDGTLINSNKELTYPTLKTIRQLMDKGIIFVISTGRSFLGIRALVAKIGYDIPCITYNGGLVIMSKSKQVLYRQILASSACQKIIQEANKRNLTYIAWSEQKLYANRFDDWVARYQKFNNVKAIIMKDESILETESIMKIIWFDQPDKIKSYEDELKREFNQNVNFFRSELTFLEFVDKDVSKAEALAVIGSTFQIKLDEIMAIGDSYNDIPMLEVAGLGVAMANAPTEVKEKAGFITLSNDEDGVVHAINRFFK